MLDWLVVKPAELAATSESSKSRKTSALKNIAIDWNWAQGLRNACGLAPFERKDALADFAQQPSGSESKKSSPAQFLRDLKESLPDWMVLK